MNLGTKKPRLKFAAVVALAGILVSGIIASPVSASLRQDYFDWGPYYSSRLKVLGFSFSSLEELPSFTLPDSAKLSSPGILPNSPFYQLEKLVENTQLAFTFNPEQKQETRLSFASERLAEAQELASKGNTRALSRAVSDYQNTLSSINNNLTKTPSLLSRIEEVTTNHAVVIQNLSLFALPTISENLNQAIESARETLDYVADNKGEPAVPENLSVGLQKLKEQGLISPEETEKLYGFDSRAKVREELDRLTGAGQFPISETAKLDGALEDRYPEVYKHILNNLEFAELRTYQTLPRSTKEIDSKIDKWFNSTSDTPPPPEIRPYLYTLRAGELAKEIDLSKFAVDQQAEVAKSYPSAVVENPTYSQLIPTESSLPSPTPVLEETQTEKEAPAAPASPGTAEITSDYLFKPSGPLPGDASYPGKRLFEQLTLAATFNKERRLEYRMRLAEERLAEVNSLSLNRDRAKEYENTLNRYKSELGFISDSLKDYPDSSQREDLAKKFELQAARHEAIFETGLIPPPSGNFKIISDVISETEKAMDRSADALGKPALPQALEYRLQDLKAQGLVLDEEISDLAKTKSREEVREKIRKLSEEGGLPLAEAKRLDEAQNLNVPANYNQLLEVRKVEELQGLRAVQAELAQTPTLKATNESLTGRASSLLSSIDISLIKPEDLAGREGLLTAYKNLEKTASPKPINQGQFGDQIIAGRDVPPPTPPSRADAVLTTCPQGAIFKQFTGCVWEESGKRLNDYDQYKCGPRQYFSFQTRTCLPYEQGRGTLPDYQPVCPVGYLWSWESQSCQTTAGGTISLPSPRPEPQPKDDKELEERSKSCPSGSSYKAPRGCVWDGNNEPVYNSRQYRCSAGTYYSFEALDCVSSPKEGQAWPSDASPRCKEEGTIWNWADGRCQLLPSPVGISDKTGLDISKPVFAKPGDSLYFLKTTFEAVQSTLAVTPALKTNIALAQAKERFAEAYDALAQKDEETFKTSLAEYTDRMQDLYNDLGSRKLSDNSKKAIADRITETVTQQNLLLGKAQIFAGEDSQDAISAASSINTLGIDKASDIRGDPAIPDEIKQKIETFPSEMIPDDKKAKILGAESRVEARIELGNLVAGGILTATDTAFLNGSPGAFDFNARVKLEELQKLGEIVDLTEKSEKINEKIEKNEEVVKKLDEFEKTFEPGDDVDAKIRPYVRLTRIDEVAQTVRPDIVNLENFSNRKDIQLAVATLQQEYKPTKEAVRQVEDFRRRNPDRSLPPDLARIEALSFSLGVRDRAVACFLPSPPFPANTPCPPPGAAIPINTYYSSSYSGIGGFRQNEPASVQTTDKDGKPFVYGQGPSPTNPGTCPDGYHWMYDSGGWCMSNGGNYSSSYTYTPTGTGGGYTPYSPYYNAPGAPPGTYGYPVGDNSPNDNCPYGYDSDGRGNCIPNSYPSPGYSYGAPSYYGPAPNYYTTTPPAGTVPGSGPRPTAPGQCPTGYHWMSDSGGWCMADGPTYVPAGTSTGITPPGGTYYSPNLTQSSCGPGYYWDGRGCIRTSPTDTYGSCSAPSGGCGYNSYWDYGSCSCRSASTYSGGSGPSPGNYCQGVSCGGGSYLDYATCSCRYSSSGSYSGSSSTGSYCSPPSGGCGSGWFDNATCSCKAASSQGCYNVSASSCGSGFYWDSSACTCRSSSTSTTSSTSSSSGGSGTSSSGSCPSGYHWMGDNGGWCMADGGGSSSTSPSTSTPPTTTTTTEPQPTQTTPTETQQQPPPQ